MRERGEGPSGEIVRAQPFTYGEDQRVRDAYNTRVVEQSGVEESRIYRIRHDPDCQEGWKAGKRTFFNTAITVADFVPVAGDSASWGADAGKGIARSMRFSMYRWLPKLTEKAEALDLTPDVSLITAVGTELLEIPGAGVVPTHIIESGLQLKYDIPRIKKGWKRAKEIWREGKKN